MALDFARLKSTLVQTRWNTTLNPAYQTVLGLIDATKESFDAIGLTVAGQSQSATSLEARVTALEAYVASFTERTFANRPITPTIGTLINISDSPVNTWGTNVTVGGGAIHALIRWNGAHWTVVGI